MVSKLGIAIVILFMRASEANELGQPLDYSELDQRQPAPLLMQHGQDSYVLLTDDELLHNADMLRHLTLASKEEIEELVEGNPAVQEMLLEKVKRILAMRQQVAALNEQRKVIAQNIRADYQRDHPNSPQAMQPMQPNQPEIASQQADADLDHHLASMEPSKVEMLKSQINSKAAKLFKVGSSLNKKLRALKRKKGTIQSHVPRFHLNVSTNKSASSTITTTRNQEAGGGGGDLPVGTQILNSPV